MTNHLNNVRLTKSLETKKSEGVGEDIGEAKEKASEVDEKLSEYASKRHFEETPEPKGVRREKRGKTHLCYPRAPCKTTPL